MVPASTDPTDANAKIAMQISKMGLRPYRSGSGPTISCSTAETARYPATDRFTSA